MLNLPGKRIAMDAQRFGGLAQIAVVHLQHARDETFLELSLRIVVTDAFLYHFSDQPLEQITHEPSPVHVQ
jgi:hypothetical protein